MKNCENSIAPSDNVILFKHLRHPPGSNRLRIRQITRKEDLLKLFPNVLNICFEAVSLLYPAGKTFLVQGKLRSGKWYPLGHTNQPMPNCH